MIQLEDQVEGKFSEVHSLIYVGDVAVENFNGGIVAFVAFVAFVEILHSHISNIYKKRDFTKFSLNLIFKS